MLATLNRQLPTLSNGVVRSAGVLIKRGGCSRLSQWFPLVENRCSGVGIPGGTHESRVWWRISYSPCAWSSFEIIIHNCWLLSVLTLRITSAKTRCNAAHSTKYLCVVCCFKTVKHALSLFHAGCSSTEFSVHNFWSLPLSTNCHRLCYQNINSSL